MAYPLLTIAAIIALASYIVYGALYRLFFSPIASFPGPRLAALTLWYEFYYDVVKQGRYTWKIAELHKKYGPIVRINPYELHIDDLEFYDQLYVGASERKSDRWSWTAPMFGAPESLFAAVDHDVHRRQRRPYNNKFSKQSIMAYSNVIQTFANKLCDNFRHCQTEGTRINIDQAYTALAGDIVSGYCFPSSYGLLDDPSFAQTFYEVWQSFIGFAHIMKQFPWLFPLMLKLPRRVVGYLVPPVATSFQWRIQWTQQILDLKMRKGEGKENPEDFTVFDTILDSDLSDQEKSTTRLVDDAQGFLAGGSLTTATTVIVATYYTLADPDIKQSLLQELSTVHSRHQAGSVPLGELEQLPYLNAVILEALRVSYGVSSRMQRISNDQTLHYKEWPIPPGTPVSMTSMFMHDNPTIFPSPHTFKPERWLPLDTEGRRLQKYMVAFGKGSRQCIGMNLAWAEMYITLATVFGKFGSQLELADTVWERDVDLVRDFFTPVPSKDSKGIWIRIRE